MNSGAADWSLGKKQDNVEDTSEDEVITRLSGKAKMIDPKLYPRIRDTAGIFKVTLAQRAVVRAVRQAANGASNGART